jgi:hypothetical protein
MSIFSDIIIKIELFNFNNLMSEEQRIISDEGQYNVPLESIDGSGHDINIRYLFLDSNEYGNRSELEIKKIKLLNESLDILFDIYTYAQQLEHGNIQPSFIGGGGMSYEELVKNDAPPDGYEDGVDNEDISSVLEIDGITDNMDTMGLL